MNTVFYIKEMSWKQRKNYMRKAIDLTAVVDRRTVSAALDELKGAELWAFLKRFGLVI